MEITAQQLRSARAFLDVSRNDVSAATGVGVQTLADLENGKTDSPRVSTLDMLRLFYESRGIEFTDEGGIRPDTNKILVYRGTEGFAAFFENVYDTAKGKEEPNICVVNADDKLFLQWHSTHAPEYIRKMGELSIKPARSLLSKGDHFRVADKYSLYKWIDQAIPSKSSLYLYGRKAAIIDFKENDVEITVVNNLSTTQMLRSMFEVLWEKGADTP